MLTTFLFEGLFERDGTARDLASEIFKLRDYEFAEDMGRAGWLIEPSTFNYYDVSFMTGLIKGQRYDLLWGCAKEPVDYRIIVGLLAENNCEEELLRFLERMRREKPEVDLISSYLSSAYESGNPNIIRILQRYQDPDRGRGDPLYGASAGGHLHLVKELFEKTDSEYFPSCVEVAMERNHQDILDFFAEKGFYCLDARLRGACSRGSPILVRTLLEECAQIDRESIDISICAVRSVGDTISRSADDVADILELLQEYSLNPEDDFHDLIDQTFYSMPFDVFRHPRLLEVCLRHQSPAELLWFLIYKRNFTRFQKHFAESKSKLTLEEINNLIECAKKKGFEEFMPLLEASLSEQ